MTITISEPVTFLVAIVIGIGIKSLADLAVAWFERRPPRLRGVAALVRDYYNPCGPKCASPTNATAAESRSASQA